MTARLLASASLLLLLAGCGSSPPSPATTTPAGTYLQLSGNWEFTGVNTTAPTLTTPIADFTGSLQSSGGTVTGTLRAFSAINYLNPCVSLTQDLTATGTLDNSGNLTLTVPISGGTATIQAPLTSNLNNFATGSFQISGGACSQALNTAAAVQFASATGTYTGTMASSSSSSTATATAVLTQASTPDADGLYPLSGSVTLAGAACNATYTFTGGAISGNGINLYHEASYTNSGGEFHAAILPDASALQAANITFYGTSCGTLSGTLKRQ